jgi:hypothetical protein
MPVLKIVKNQLIAVASQPLTVRYRYIGCPRAHHHPAVRKHLQLDTICKYKINKALKSATSLRSALYGIHFS